jgi:hypothetical protein
MGTRRGRQVEWMKSELAHQGLQQHLELLAGDAPDEDFYRDVIHQAIEWCAPPATTYGVLSRVYGEIKDILHDKHWPDEPGVAIYNAWDWLERKITARKPSVS